MPTSSGTSIPEIENGELTEIGDQNKTEKKSRTRKSLRTERSNSDIKLPKTKVEKKINISPRSSPARSLPKMSNSETKLSKGKF